MKSLRLKAVTAATLFATFAMLIVTPLPTNAGQQCPPDVQQWLSQATIPFGGPRVLGQTFIPNAEGRRVCRVKVRIVKNNPFAGPLTLHVLRSNFAPLDSATILPGAIPMGASIQVFEFNCNGFALEDSPFYGLKLESPASPPGAYSWFGSAANPYFELGIGGQGWINEGAGWQAIANGTWDYVFGLYLCE
ncbi:MAG TPA: hypothetical protein VID27_03935 [Blastocatellia bacterium]|jgi:hypothetical protein